MRLRRLCLAALVPAAVAAGPTGVAALEDRACPGWTFTRDGGPEGNVPTIRGCAGRGNALAEIEITCSAVRYLPSVFPMEAGAPDAPSLVRMTVAGGGSGVTVPFASEAGDGMLSDGTSLGAVTAALLGGSDVLMHLADTPPAYADRFVARGFAEVAAALREAC